MAVAKKTTTLSLKPTAKSAVDGGETKKADVTPKAETTTPPNLPLLSQQNPLWRAQF